MFYICRYCIFTWYSRHIQYDNTDILILILAKTTIKSTRYVLIMFYSLFIKNVKIEVECIFTSLCISIFTHIQVQMVNSWPVSLCLFFNAFFVLSLSLKWLLLYLFSKGRRPVTLHVSNRMLWVTYYWAWIVTISWLWKYIIFFWTFCWQFRFFSLM